MIVTERQRASHGLNLEIHKSRVHVAPKTCAFKIR